VTNKSTFNLLLPLVLVLDPAQGYDGVPADALGRAPDGRWLIDLSGALPGGILAPGQTTTGQTITVDNPHNLRVSYDPSVSAQTPSVPAPVFDSTPVTAAAAGQAYAYQIKAHQPSGGALVYVLDSGPAGLSVDAETGLVKWAPTRKSPAQATV